MNITYFESVFKNNLHKKFVIRILSLLAVISLVFTGTVYAQLPEPTREFYYGDYAGLLKQDTKTSIRSVNLNYESTKEKPQVVVSTVRNMGGLDIETYAVELFEKWKIGNKDLNNGVLILLALEERKIRIEVGYGLEGAITDGAVGKILDNAIPFLSDGDYDSGILQIFYEVTDKINAEYGYDSEKIYSGSTQSPLAKTSKFNKEDLFTNIGFIIFFLILAKFGTGGGGGGYYRSSRGSFSGGRSFGGGGRSGGGGGSRGF